MRAMRSQRAGRQPTVFGSATGCLTCLSMIRPGDCLDGEQTKTV
jgi:hypothetical protein